LRPAILAVLLALAYTASGLYTATIVVVIHDSQGRELAQGSTLPKVKLAGPAYSESLYCSNCSFSPIIASNETSLTFNLTVEWMGVKVHEGAISVANGTVQRLTVNASVSRLKIYGYADDGSRVDDCTLRLEGPVVAEAKTGSEVLLPHGSYNLTSALLKFAAGGEVAMRLTYTVNVDAKTLSLKVNLPVAGSIQLRITKSDGSPLPGDAFVSVYYQSPLGPKVFNGSLGGGGAVTLYKIPYGTYFVEAYWTGKNVLSTYIRVNESSKSFSLKSEVMAGVKIRVLDWDGNPASNAQLLLEGPGRKLVLKTDVNGIAELSEALPGYYNCSLSFMNETVSTPVYLSGQGIETIMLPVRKVAISVKPRWESSLPTGLDIVLLHKASNTPLLSRRSSSEVGEVRLELDEYIPVSARLVLEVYWNGTLIRREELEATAPLVSVALPLSETTIILEDVRGGPVPGARLIVTDEVGSYEKTTDEYGRAWFSHLYGDSISVEAYWMNLKVAVEKIRCGEDTVHLRARVTPLAVQVLGALGQPLSGMNLTLSMVGAGVHLTLTGVTSSSGNAYFRVVPLLPGLELLLRASKGRVTVEHVVTGGELDVGIVIIRADVMVDLGWLQLTTLEVVAVSAAVAIAGLTAVKVYKYHARRSAQYILSEYTPRWETGGAALLGRLKERLKVLFGLEEGEKAGEEELFEEHE